MDELEIGTLGTIQRGDFTGEFEAVDDVGADLHVALFSIFVVVRFEMKIDDLVFRLPSEFVSQVFDRGGVAKLVAPFASTGSGAVGIVPELDVRARGRIVHVIFGVADVHDTVPAALNQHGKVFIIGGFVTACEHKRCCEKHHQKH